MFLREYEARRAINCHQNSFEAITISEEERVAADVSAVSAVVWNLFVLGTTLSHVSIPQNLNDGYVRQGKCVRENTVFCWI